MNQQEQTRTQVLNSVLECQLSIAQAAEIVGFSQRHTKRILAAYRRDGPAALAHGNRGRRPHNAVPEAAATAVVKLASNNYAGANHTYLTELLREREGIDLSRPTVRRILAKAGMGSPRSRRSPQHRFRRRRMLREGLVRQWGIPLALHSDRHPAFKYNACQAPVLAESTQFAKVMRALGIRQIFALSPQAKGRVERMASTFQDRLVTELHLAGVSAIDQSKLLRWYL